MKTDPILKEWRSELTLLRRNQRKVVGDLKAYVKDREKAKREIDREIVKARRRVDREGARIAERIGILEGRLG